MTTPWDPLHRAYFNGYALWTYMTTPFLLADPEIKVTEIAALQEGDETWRGLRATFPDSIATHSREQDFYFAPDGRLRCHDYHVDVAGGFAARAARLWIRRGTRTAFPLDGVPSSAAPTCARSPTG